MIHPHIIRAVHLVSGIVLGLITLFTPRNKKRVIFNSSLNNFYNFNSRYLFEYFLERNKYECFFVINDDARRANLITKIGPYFISSKGLKNKLFILTASTWVCSTMETPVGGFLLSFRRFVYNLGHGVPIKKAGIAQEKYIWYKDLYYKMVRTNFTKFLATSLYSQDRYSAMYGCATEQIVINPQPRLSSVKVVERDDSKLKVLYAPTWREGGTSFFSFEDVNECELLKFLSENNICIYLHPHPVRTQYVSRIKECEYVQVIKPNPERDVTGYLADFDILMTDYSSIYVDYLVLNRPVFFVFYETQDFNDEIGVFDGGKDFSIGPQINSQKELILELEKVVQKKDEYISARKEMSLKLNGDFKQGDECKINYDFITAQLQ